MAMLVLLPAMLRAATLRVGAGGHYTSISSAIAAAKDGDTIYVSQGIYKEDTLILDKPIALIGQGRPVIDGQHKIEMMRVTGRHILIKGFVFRNSGNGSIKDVSALAVHNAKDITVEDNIFEDNYFAIYLGGTRHALIKNNKITGPFRNETSSGNGIHLWKCDSIEIDGNSITGHRDGMYFEFAKHCIITHNESFHNTRYGLHFMFSDGNTYAYNRFSRNGSGVAVMYTKNISMQYNTFENNWGSAAYGLLLKSISRSSIQHNRFSDNTVGIYVEESDKLNISSNHFSSNGWALKIMSASTEDTLVNNNFFVNTFDVSTTGSTNTNFFSHNYWDKYRGYDLDKNGSGDVPYRPVSLFSMLMERMPHAVMMIRSIVADILDQVERVYPQLIPESLTDGSPEMAPLPLDLPELKPDKDKTQPGGATAQKIPTPKRRENVKI